MGVFNARQQISAIGLEIDAHEFHAVQLIRSPKGISTLAWAKFPRRDEHGDTPRESFPESDELRWAASILGRRGFVGNTVSIVLSSASCSSHVIELPPAESGAPIEQLARMEIARAQRCSPDDFEFGYWGLPSKGRSEESIAVAIPRTTIDQAIEVYEQGGLIPGGIDLIELAIHRASETGKIAVETEINALLHISWSSSLAVLTLGDQVVYVRRIERGVSSVWDLARGRYKLSSRGADAVLDSNPSDSDSESFAKIHRSAWTGLATELANELDVATAYVSHSFRMAPFGKIRTSGYGGGNKIIEEQLDKVLGIPIECTPPSALMDGIGMGGESRVLAGRLLAAYGLAARFDQ